MPFFVLARRNDEVISRYFEELQRRQRGKGPENHMTNFCSRGLVHIASPHRGARS
jgi:hypothetical protein